MRRAMPLVVTIAMLLLAGCQWLGVSPSDAKPVGPGGDKGAVEVVIHYPAGAPVRKTIEFAGSPSVLDVTRRAAPVQTDFTPNGEQQVVAIGGEKNDPARARLWVYEVNNLSQSAAANLKYVTHGDVVRWRYK